LIGYHHATRRPTLSNRSYNSPTVCFSFPFTQLTQTPGPSMTLFPQTGVPSCAACQTRMFEHHIQPVSLTERYRFLGFAPPSRGRLEVDIVNSAQFSAPYCTGPSRVSYRLRYLSATGPRAGKFALDLMNCMLCVICPLKIGSPPTMAPGYAIP
jgi:hypothetical protein